MYRFTTKDSNIPRLDAMTGQQILAPIYGQNLHRCIRDVFDIQDGVGNCVVIGNLIEVAFDPNEEIWKYVKTIGKHNPKVKAPDLPEGTRLDKQTFGVKLPVWVAEVLRGMGEDMAPFMRQAIIAAVEEEGVVHCTPIEDLEPLMFCPKGESTGEWKYHPGDVSELVPRGTPDWYPLSDTNHAFPVAEYSALYEAVGGEVFYSNGVKKFRPIENSFVVGEK